MKLLLINKDKYKNCMKNSFTLKLLIHYINQTFKNVHPIQQETKQRVFKLTKRFKF